MRSRSVSLAFALFFIFVSFGVFGYHQQVVKITGRVTDRDRKIPLSSASVIVKDNPANSRTVGTSTGDDGTFVLFVRSTLPFKLVISYVGYETMELDIQNNESLNVQVELQSKSQLADEIIVTGQKIAKEDLRSPISKEVINVVELQQTPSFNIYDAVSNMRGVDMATQSLLINSVNTRGFNATTNLRFSQFVDGIDNQAPGLNIPLSNIAGLTDLDLESIELVPGPSTGTNGPGSFNGTLVLTSKNPFDYPGISSYMKVGVNEMNEGASGTSFFDFGGNPVLDIGLRYADNAGKFGWKVTTSYLRAVDFKANNYENIGPGNIFDTFVENPGISAVNIYGDERSARLSLGTPDSIVTVTRTGYREEDLVDYNISNVKFGSAIYFRLAPDSEIVLQGSYGAATTMFSGDNRIYLRGFSMQQYKAEFNSPRVSLKLYSTRQNAGDSYDAGLLANQMLSIAKPDDIWFNHFQIAYNGFPLAGSINSYERARGFADSGYGNQRPFFIPGSFEFDSLKRALIRSTDRMGAAIFDRSALYHAEGKYRFEKSTYNLSLELGINMRLYDPESKGTIFPDSIGNDISILEGGGYIKGVKNLGNNYTITSILRVDKNSNFRPVLNPSIQIVKTIREIHNIRASFQSGFRYPGVREQFLNQNLGDIQLLGGLPELIRPLQLEGNAFTLQTREAFNQAVEKDISFDPIRNPERYSRLQAEIKNLPILESNVVVNRYSGIRPEQVNSFEIGYRSLFEGRRLIDISYYRSSFNNFIGIVRFVKPRTSPQIDLLASAQQMNNSSQSDLFFLYANASEKVIAQGLEFTYDVTSRDDFLFIFNFTWAQITKTSNDPIIPAFNTPRFKYNISFGHRRITPNVGFKISWRLRDKFMWESAFGDGEVPSINTMDFQFTVKMPSIKTNLKLGASNLFNDRAPNVFGGPGISTLLYMNLTYDVRFNKEG